MNDELKKYIDNLSEEECAKLFGVWRLCSDFGKSKSESSRVFMADEMEMMFAQMVYQFQAYHRLPNEAIVHMMTRNPEYARKMASEWADFLEALSRVIRSAGML